MHLCLALCYPPQEDGFMVTLLLLGSTCEIAVQLQSHVCVHRSGYITDVTVH